MAGWAAFAFVERREVGAGAYCALWRGGRVRGLVMPEEVAFVTMGVRAGGVVLDHSAHSVKQHENLNLPEKGRTMEKWVFMDLLSVVVSLLRIWQRVRWV